MADALPGGRNRLKSLGISLYGALIGLALFSSLGWIPGSASALGFVIAPGATFDSVSAPSVALTGRFELTLWPSGICGSPCEPDAYSMSAVVLTTGGDTLSNGILEPISYAGDISCCLAPMSFLDSDPLEVLFSTPRGRWPLTKRRPLHRTGPQSRLPIAI